jgi:tyrosine-protein kinase
MAATDGRDAGMKATGATALGEYVRVLRRGALLIVAVTAIVTGIAVGLSLAQEKRYESHADVFLSGANNLPPGLAGDQQNAVDPARASNTQAKLARVPQVAALALRSADLTDRTPGELIDSSSVTNPPDTDILRFSVTDASPATATKLASSYASAYSRYRRQLDTAAIVNARRQIERRMRSLEAAGNTKSGLYRRLATEDQQLQTTQALRGSNVAVVRQGSEAAQTQPKPLRNGVLGGIFGLILGVALVFVRDALTTRVRSASEVEERLGLAMIGRVPQLSRHLRNGSGVAMLAEPASPAAEAFRILATNLGFVNLDRGAKSIMVTSASDGEGKSTTAGNLAVALASMGNRVSLVDLDLKRPALDRLFQLEAGQPGLSSVVLGMIELNEALTEVPLLDPQSETGARATASPGKLMLLPTGPIPHDTTRFMALPAIAQVLETLTRESDIVLVDAPPLPRTSDAMALTGKVDALVVVTRIAQAQRPALEELRRVLDSAPIAKLGVVVTGVSPTDTYGYGYGHGAGSSNGGPTRIRRKEPLA